MSKPDWIVCDMINEPLRGPDDEPEVFKTAAAALERAKQHVNVSDDSEAWVYRLSHIVSRPTGEPDVEEIK